MWGLGNDTQKRKKDVLMLTCYVRDSQGMVVQDYSLTLYTFDR
jgi:hypothetical protein